MPYYIDYPGLSQVDPRGVADRLHDTYVGALAEARDVYVNSDVPKVIVANFPQLLRVATVFGDRTNPTVRRRRK